MVPEPSARFPVPHTPKTESPSKTARGGSSKTVRQMSRQQLDTQGSTVSRNVPKATDDAAIGVIKNILRYPSLTILSKFRKI